MSELDRFILHRLYKMVKKSCRAYEEYEFHVIYHALHNFCVVDLSAFYLDIIKDRLYTSAPDDPKRRDAQTVMALILDALVRIMAPILPFTADEIYQFMPGSDKRDSVHLEAMVQPDETWKDDALAEKWEAVLDLRTEVTKALEEARTAKLIGHPLDACLEIKLPDTPLKPIIETLPEALNDIFIVSSVHLVDSVGPKAFQGREIKGLEILVHKAAGEKCDRCWRFDQTIGRDPDHPLTCERCAIALKKIL